MRSLILILIATKLFGFVLIYEKKCFLNRNNQLVCLVKTDSQASVIFPDLGIKNGDLKLLKYGSFVADDEYIYYTLYDIKYKKWLHIDKIKVKINNKEYIIKPYDYGEIKDKKDILKYLESYHHNNSFVYDWITKEIIIFVLLYILGSLFVYWYKLDKFNLKIGVEYRDNKAIYNKRDIKNLYYYLVEKGDKELYEKMNKIISPNKFFYNKSDKKSKYLFDLQELEAIENIYQQTKQKYFKAKKLTLIETILVLILSIVIWKVILCNF